MLLLRLSMCSSSSLYDAAKSREHPAREGEDSKYQTRSKRKMKKRPQKCLAALRVPHFIYLIQILADDATDVVWYV